MSQRILCKAALAISALAAGLAFMNGASAHESHGAGPMSVPGYEWGGHGMMPPRAGMWPGHGPMAYEPCPSPEGYGSPYRGQQYRRHMGPGMMGGGMMGPGMMGPGMMGPGTMGGGMMGGGMMGGGMMGPGARTMPGDAFDMGSPLANDLTVEQVKHILGHRLQRLGLTRLKVGEVTEQDDDVIVAEIVTEDGSLVQRLEVDRHFGWSHPVE